MRKLVCKEQTKGIPDIHVRDDFLYETDQMRAAFQVLRCEKVGNSPCSEDCPMREIATDEIIQRERNS